MENGEKFRLLEHQPKAVLRVRGEDSAIFLQGQFTNDLKIDSGKLAYGLWLTQKGKVLADSYVLRVGENEFLVISESSPAEVIYQRLEQYIIADDVLISDETERFSALTIWGEEKSTLLRVLGALPERGHFVSNGQVLVFLGRESSDHAWVVVGPAAEVATCSAALGQAGFQMIDSVMAERMRIAAGIPAVPRDIGAMDLPNEGGLETVAISYTKGCYLGQEVMARLKNLGQVRRRLQVMRGAGSPPAYLAPLYQGSVKVGEIRSAVVDGDDFLAWAMMSLVTFNPELGCALAPDGAVSVTLVRHG